MSLAQPLILLSSQVLVANVLIDSSSFNNYSTLLRPSAGRNFFKPLVRWSSWKETFHLGPLVEIQKQQALKLYAFQCMS
jgi:hypothetical protein